MGETGFAASLETVNTDFLFWTNIIIQRARRLIVAAAALSFWSVWGELLARFEITFESLP